MKSPARTARLMGKPAVVGQIIQALNYSHWYGHIKY